MGQITQGGVRVFSSSSKEGLEFALNEFLSGDGTVENPRKIVEQIEFTIDSAVFYALIVYKTV